MPLKVTTIAATGENLLFDFLKVDPGFDDANINRLFEGAKAEAETFLNTDFSTLDADGNRVENEAPSQVQEWIFNRTAQKYETAGAWVKPDFSLLQPLRIYPFRG